MKAAFVSAIAVVLLAGDMAAAETCARGLRATALIMSPPTIDGDLSDWPDDMPRYEISGSAPSVFRVGYNPDEARVYVAIEVEDDEHIAGGRWDQTDATDVYTWGGHADLPCKSGPPVTNPIQFAYVHGDGEMVPNCGNPCLHANRRHAPAANVGVEVKATRRNGHTLYEWSVPVIVNMQDGAVTRLSPGKTIGFDILVSDEDSKGGGYFWSAWGTPHGLKFDSPTRVGLLHLSEDHATSSVWASLSQLGSWAGTLALVGLGVIGIFAAGTAARRALSNRSGGRVGELEQRLTDTQDVLIALTDKVEQLDQRVAQLQTPTDEDRG